MKHKNRLFLPPLLAAFLAGPAFAGEPTPVSGLRPYERPAGAPVVDEFVAGEGWHGRAVRGLGEPLTGVGFLKDQGAWYTPFDRPNLPGRYDLRGLHAATGKGKP